MKKIKIIYWIATALIIVMIGLGSFADIFMIDAMRESIQHQGFPVHFLLFFGIVKLLAVTVIVLPALKKFKFAAYVGLFWYFLGAVYSHFSVEDTFQEAMGAIIALILVLVSYFAWTKIETDQAS